MVKLNRNKLVKYKDQIYSDLKKHHEEQGSLFLDSTFPSVENVIGATSVPAGMVWKRPKEMSENPRLLSDDGFSTIVRAGELSCNWMVSACAILAGVNEIRNKVIPDYWEQEWGDKKYTGMFFFRFWRFGNWTEVTIDDFLPVVDKTLVTTQSAAENEFWPALVEKAYAKLHGSYDALREGELSDALVDFTGGVTETIDLQAGMYNELEDKRLQLFETLHKEMLEHSVICFTVSAPTVTNIGERTETGLIKGHSYHMTDVKKVHLGETTLRSLFNGREKVPMVRLRDPRQEEKKIPGSPDSALSNSGTNPFAFSTESLSQLRSRNVEWQKLKDNERQRLGLIFRNSNEFWMPLEDAVWEFSEIIICRLVCENFFAAPGKKWKGSSVRGIWESGPKDTKLDRSGGGDVTNDNFLKNPQYIMDVDGDTEILIQLLQHQEQEPTTSSTILHQLIGFHIVKVENNRTTRVHKLWNHLPIVVAEDHKRKREIIYRGKLAAGRYVIVPTTYREGDECLFLLRAFSKDEHINIKELKEDVPRQMNPCSCIFPDIEWVTVITVENAELEHQKSHNWASSRTSPYCSIQCEGTKVKTNIALDDNHPEWNESFIFFRKKTQKPLLVKVYSKNSLLPNQLLGECELPAAITHGPTPLDAGLIIKRKNNAETETLTAGTLHLTVLTEDNIHAV